MATKCSEPGCDRSWAKGFRLFRGREGWRCADHWHQPSDRNLAAKSLNRPLTEREARADTAKRAIVGALAALAVSIGMAAPAFAVTPFACPISTVTTGGVAVLAIPSKVNGAVIANPVGATESLFVDQTTTATTTASATNFALAAGQSWFVIPSSTLGVSVNAATSSHAFFCEMW